MSDTRVNRRDFLVGTMATVGTTTTLAAKDLSSGDNPQLPDGIHSSDPLAKYFANPVSQLVEVPLPPELTEPEIQERHQIYCLLLMALVARFWNGNNNGPFGIYPYRESQKAKGQNPDAEYFRYGGDLHETDDPQRISWDRYIGHNIACLAVDGNGEIIDFEFNHNSFFRSSAEHAESRLIRRLFSLTNLIDNWKVGGPLPNKARSFSLKDTTIYTSLESCAQCSGVMSLGRVKQVVYLQNDPGAYRIGNIMYNLAGHEEQGPRGDGSSLAPLPIAASGIGLQYLQELNTEYERFRKLIADAEMNRDSSAAYFIRTRSSAPVFTDAITSFLCTDVALDTFRRGAIGFRDLKLRFGNARFPKGDAWTNEECLCGARSFFTYADVEGFRGSPHKL